MGQLWLSDPVGEGHAYSSSWVWKEKGGRKELWSLGSTRKAKATAGCEEPPTAWQGCGAASANSASYSPGLYFLPQQGEKGVEVGGSQESGSFEVKSCFCCLPGGRAGSHRNEFVVPVREAMLTWNSWIGLMFLKAAAKPKWEGKFSRELCAESPRPQHPHRLGLWSPSAHALGPLTKDLSRGNLAGRVLSSGGIKFE